MLASYLDGVSRVPAHTGSNTVVGYESRCRQGSVKVAFRPDGCPHGGHTPERFPSRAGASTLGRLPSDGYRAAEVRIATPILHIHVDESCLGNQFQGRANPGGAAGLVESWSGNEWVRRDYWLSERDTTNNRMAIRSGIEGLTLLTKRCRVEVVSDSQYLVKGMNEWLPGWKAAGWKRKGGPIQNLELWRQLDRAATHHDVMWTWVRGHAGHPKNEYANDLAVLAAQDLTRSGGLVPSGFQAWLEEQREKKGRYLDYFEFEAPA